MLQVVEQPVDASALAFLEEAEANDLEVEYMELVRSGFSKSPASLERMRGSRSAEASAPPEGSREEEEEEEEAKSFPRAPLFGLFLLARFALGNLDIFPVVLPGVRCLDSTLSLVRFWIHAHASVYASFGTAPCIWQSLVRRCLCLRSTVSPFF